jgi:hypothetical protein
VDDIKIENVSQHGRDFSVISVPYTLKLLIQELGCMNIQLRIITEDNIEHLENFVSSFNKTELDKVLNRVVQKKVRVVEPEPEPEPEIEIANPDAGEWVVKQDDIPVPEAKITPEPNVKPVLGETIYGWTLGMSEKYNHIFWFKAYPKTSLWVDPPIIVRRNEILKIARDNNFTGGNLVYYLGGDMNDPTLKPDIVWKIENISRERKILTLVEMDDPSNRRVFPNFSIELLRHVNTTPEPTTITEQVGGDKLVSQSGNMGDKLVSQSGNMGDKLVSQSGNMGDYLIDEIVYLEDDMKFERPWHITGISNGRIMITTDDNEGLME